MNEKQEKLIKLLEDMFQLNQTDLDFGIYRIMNQKSDEIKQFLQKDLIASIKNAFSVNSNDGLQKELNDLISTITNAGMNPEDSPKVKEIREKLSSSSNNESTENEIYSYLTNFFSRYYKDGDFVSLRRYKKDTYAIPYEGEEVKLHWANSDQYYIKTSENLRDYTFVVNDKKFHFKIVDADTEKNNNKSSEEERRFILDSETPLYEENGEVFISFEYKSHKSDNDKSKDKVSKQDFLNKEAIEIVLTQDNEMAKLLKEYPKLKNGETSKLNYLEKYLKEYTSKNSFDYFIHKDLKGFLSRELDFFIKNEILNIDDVLYKSTSEIESSLEKIKTFKTIANKIIAFLSQLEDFQKKLWLKKKFITETNYCITLDKIDKSFYEEIINSQIKKQEEGHDNQLDEWKTLFDVNIKTIEDLKKDKYLVLDTKFFNIDFTNKLLSEFENIDEVCDGVLINSENFGALNLLQDRYKEQVKTVYIDPPYNTGSDGFLYIDNYKHSSWMTFMYDRLMLAHRLMSSNSVLFSSIDENENYNLKSISSLFFQPIDTIKLKVKAQSGDSSKFESPFTDLSEYIHFYSKSDNYDFTEIDIVKEYVDNNSKTVNQYKYLLENIGQIQSDKSYSFKIDKGKTTIDVYEVDNFKYSTIKTSDRTESYYIENIEYIIRTAAFSGEFKKQFSKKKDKVYYFEYEITRGKNEGKIAQIYAVNGEQLLFLKNYTKVIEEKGEKRLVKVEKLSNLWTDLSWTGIASEGKVELKNGKKPEKLLERVITLGSSNKPKKETILDFFAGSGTTPSVAHKLNKNYIAIEMGEYFDNLVVKRMKYTLNGNSGGISSVSKGGMFKYFKLESYEDCLNNLAFKNTDRGLFDDNVNEDYLLNYMLDYETNESLLNIDSFKNPYSYKLKIATSSAGETVETNVDLVETFNYLIGLKVKTRVMNKGFLVIQGENLKEEKILVIWRDGKSNDELNSFFEKMDWTVYDREFDIIYVNGDNNLANLKKDEEHFKVKLIEEEFKARMFGE